MSLQITFALTEAGVGIRRPADPRPRSGRRLAAVRRPLRDRCSALRLRARALSRDDRHDDLSDVEVRVPALGFDITTQGDGSWRRREGKVRAHLHEARLDEIKRVLSKLKAED
jgi:hypothetical protein